MGIKAKKLKCAACDVRFSVYSMRQQRSGYFCPLCGDSEDVKVYRDCKSPLHPGNGTMPRWSEEDKAKLREMYQSTNYTYRDMGHSLQRSEKAVRGQLNRMFGNAHGKA